MGREVIFEKLDSLRRCVKRIEEKRPVTAEALKTDIDTQDIITLNITRAVQISVDICMHIISEYDLEPAHTMSDAFLRLEEYGIIDRELSRNLQRSVGFRNVAIHEYQSIDWEIVYVICHDHLNQFAEFAGQVSDWIERR